MSKPAKRNSILVILGGLGWPLVWGLGACIAFYALIRAGVINNALVLRYFAGHEIEYIETAMFFIGMAALCLKAIDVMGQHLTVGGITLDDGTVRKHRDAEDATTLLESLNQLSARARKSYLGRRLREALEFIERKGSAEGLDDELKYFADNDAARQHDSYSLVRIIIWATPMLGFLGTVIGITLALSSLSQQGSLLASNPQEAINILVAELSIAFDTTALALSLSIVLMFFQFAVEQFEMQLLGTVDERAAAELVGKFSEYGGSSDPHVASIERMGKAVIHATEKLVERQSHLWQETIDAAHDQWSQLVGTSTGQVQTALTGALSESLEAHATRLADNERDLAEQSRKRWEQWQMALSENARLLRDQQTGMNRQSELLGQVVQATGDVVSLERALNDNLSHLAGAKNFEDTVMSLSAAIHLLNTKLGGAENLARVELDKSEPQGRAA